MKKYYETDRLTLTLTNDKLMDFVYDYIRRNKCFLSPYEKVDEEEYFPKGDTRALVIRDIKRFENKETLNLWIRKKGDEEVIGSVGLSDINLLEELKMANLNYRLDYREVRKGYMEEACRKCMDIAFDELGLHRLNVIIMKTNEPSLKLAHKLGFSIEGIAKQFIKINGCWEDHVLMALLRD